MVGMNVNDNLYTKIWRRAVQQQQDHPLKRQANMKLQPNEGDRGTNVIHTNQYD